MNSPGVTSGVGTFACSAMYLLYQILTRIFLLVIVIKNCYFTFVVKFFLAFFNGRFGQIRKDLTTPERPFEFLGKEKFFKIFAFFGVAEATRSSRQFLELRPKAERIEGGGKSEPPPTFGETECELFRKRAPNGIFPKSRKFGSARGGARRALQSPFYIQGQAAG